MMKNIQGYEILIAVICLISLISSVYLHGTANIGSLITLYIGIIGLIALNVSKRSKQNTTQNSNKK